WQETNGEESLIEAVETSPPKTKKPTRARQKRMIQSDDAPDRLHGHIRKKLRWLKFRLMFPIIAGLVTRGRKLDFGVWFWRTWKAKQNSAVFEQIVKNSLKWMTSELPKFATESEVDEVQKIRRLMSRDKARDDAKKKSRKHRDSQVGMTKHWLAIRSLDREVADVNGSTKGGDKGEV
ncbi:hypothetical protein Tco_0369026, partial [Tanacetum coccineum]